MVDHHAAGSGEAPEAGLRNARLGEPLGVLPVVGVGEKLPAYKDSLRCAG
jgi:hypothetical protein